MTLEKQIKEKYQETCEKRDAIQKEVDLNKVGEVVISILEIFQETVRGQLIGKIFISVDEENETRIVLKGKKKYLRAQDCKKIVAEKINKVDSETLNESEIRYLKAALKKYCDVISEDNYLSISLKE